MDGNIRIDRLSLGRGADRGTDISLAPAQAISFPLVRTTTLG